MKKIIENISIIHNNIFVLTPLFVSFYKNYKGQRNDLLLSYLILPIVLHQKCIENLQNIRSNSNLVARLVSNKDCMAGFSERFEFYKQTTNQCMQYAIDCGYITINNLQVKVINDEIPFRDTTLADATNLASNLWKLFKSLDVVHIYYAFGIKQL
jgi:hypothetical protein